MKPKMSKSQRGRLFQRSGLRWTLPRKAILDLLSRTPRHMNAKEIFATLQKHYPGIGLSTIYRTLDLLTQKKLLNRLYIGEGQSRYEYRSEAETEHRHHIICTRCGKIIDYSDFLEEELALIKRTEENLAKKYQFRVYDHNIESYGLCKNCQ